MEEIKIIEGFKEDFESGVNTALEEGWYVCLETHRMSELCGKPYYSCVFARSKIKGGNKK